MISLLLNKWVWIGLAVIGTHVAAYRFGVATVEDDWQDERDAREIASLNLQSAQAEVTIKTITEYVDVIKEVKVKGDTIIKQVPVYVTEKADNYCAITNGFVLMHDAAANNAELPNPPENADDPAQGVEISDVGRAVAQNYKSCHENAEQLKALQLWALEQSSLANQQKPVEQ